MCVQLSGWQETAAAAMSATWRGSTLNATGRAAFSHEHNSLFVVGSTKHVLAYSPIVAVAPVATAVGEVPL